MSPHGCLQDSQQQRIPSDRPSCLAAGVPFRSLAAGDPGSRAEGWLGPKGAAACDSSQHRHRALHRKHNSGPGAWLQDIEAADQKARLARKGLQPKSFPRVALDLATTVERIQQNFVISDPSLPDSPIVFASEGFLDMVGYPRTEVLGRNCRFLQVRSCRVWGSKP